MKNNFKKMMLLFGLILFGLSSKAQNNALHFDGVNDYVNIDNVAPKLAGDNSFTIEFWMKADMNAQTSSIRTVLFSINSTETETENGLLIILGGTTSQTGQLMIYDEASGTNADIVTNTVIGDNVCHHIVYERDGNLGYVLIDGVLAGWHQTNFSISSNDLVSLGQEWDNLATNPTASQFLNGSLDEVRIWNTARTQQQIVDNMDLNLTGTEAGLVALYNCNQGVAGGNNTGTSTLTNSTSTPGLSGVLTNFLMTGNQSNFVKNPCLNLDCEALDNPSYTQITSNLTISSNAVWSGKYYIADGVTVTVNNGATLDLTNVDLVFGRCAGMNFVNKGNIRANNSVFRSCSIYGTWNGLNFQGVKNEVSNNIINECTFKNAEMALVFNNYNSDALISNNLFSNCYVGIKAFRTNFQHTISGNKFITEEFYPEFSSCTGLISNTSYSIYANNTSFYEPISQNEFINSNDSITAIGFESSFGGGELTNNTFTDLNNAINIISAINNFTIGSNQIVKNTIDGHGIYIYNSFRSLIEINDNILTNHKYGNITENGIYLDKSYYVSISNNQIEGYNTGIYTHNSANLQISNNLITNARNFGIAYDTDVTDFIGKIFITCNEIRMYNLLGTGIFIKDMTWNNLIATNCIFDSKTAIDLVNTTTNSNLFMPKIRNNYLYNYTSIGINIDNYIGNIGSNTALDQGMNTFWSNTMNTATDIQSTNPITTAYNFGVNNISPQVTISSESQYYSTASCSNQIEYKEGGVQSLLVEDYNCDNTSFIADLLTGNGGVSSFIDHSISNLAESDNQFMLARVIIGYFDNINDQQFNQILNETDLSNNEELLLKYQYHYKNEDYANAKLAITNFTPTNEREVNLKTVCLIDLKAIEFDWSSISTQEKEALNQIINEKSEFSNVAISLNNHVSNYMPYQVSTLDARDIEISSETINLNSDSETLSIYPSPTNSMITVDIINLNENDEILIYDITGKLVMNYSISFSTGKLNVNVENFEKGVYFVTINSSTKGTTKKGKFVKI